MRSRNLVGQARAGRGWVCVCVLNQPVTHLQPMWLRLPADVSRTCSLTGSAQLIQRQRGREREGDDLPPERCYGLFSLVNEALPFPSGPLPRKHGIVNEFPAGVTEGKWTRESWWFYNSPVWISRLQVGVLLSFSYRSLELFGICSLWPAMCVFTNTEALP